MYINTHTHDTHTHSIISCVINGTEAWTNHYKYTGPTMACSPDDVVATMSRLLKIIGLFGRISSL